MQSPYRLILIALLAMALAACETALPDPDSESAVPGTWLIMLYTNADDEILEEDMFIDINEAELVGSSDEVTIVAQVDRYEGAFDGDDDWSDTRRLLISQDDDMARINSEVVEELGEVNMADGQTLTDFVTWAATTYPAEHYVLIMSDHGMGWPGGWSDTDSAIPGPDGLAMTANGDMLLLNEMSAALAAAQDAAGIDQFELIGFDACLMGQIEVLTSMAPHARHVVASQEVEPALGWAYASFLSELVADPTMDGATLSTAIVDSYIDQDARIVDDEARAVFAEENFGDDSVSATDAAEALSIDITLSAYNTTAVPDLLSALDAFSTALAAVDQQAIAEARTYSQSFENVFAEDGPSPYIDLGHFAELVREIDDDDLTAAADDLLATIAATVIAERHGEDRSGATGVSIYFPSSELYDGDASGADSYATIADAFAINTLWENFLNFHYYGIDLADDATPTGAVTAPGASEIGVADLEISEERINQGGSTIISTEVSGEYIGFIYAFTGYYNPEDDTILVADIEYIYADESREVGGVFYPNWGDEGGVAIEHEWEPIIYGINDGTGTGVSFALLTPEDYGDTDESPTYTVDGMYTFASGEQRYAQLSFKDGKLLKVLGFNGQSAQGAPRVITPRTGDTFTIYDEYIRLNSDSDADVEYYQEEGSTLTFAGTKWEVDVLTAPSGDYVLGIQAEDFDGNLYEAYTTVTVDE